MYVNKRDFNNIDKETISNNFKLLLTKNSRPLKNSNLTHSNKIKTKKMPTVDANDIDFTKLTPDQIKELAKRLKECEDSAAKNDKTSNDLLSHILNDNDPIKIKAKSANQRIIHPWSKHLSLFCPDLMSGNDVTVDVARASDFSIYKAITAWILEDDEKLTNHQKSLLRVTQKINESEFQLHRSSGKTFSLLMQVVFFIDAAYHNEGKCDDSKVDEMVLTFRGARGFYQGPPYWPNDDANANNHNSKQSNYSFARKRNFNQSSSNFQQSQPGFIGQNNIQTGYMPNLYQNQQINPFTQNNQNYSNWAASLFPNNQSN